MNPLNDDRVRTDIETLPDYTVTDNKPYKNQKLYETRDYLNGEQLCTMAATLLEYNGYADRVRTLYNQLEKEMHKRGLTDLDLDDDETDVSAVYNHFKLLNLPSNNNSHFWRAAWGVFTGYMDIVEQDQLIAEWKKQDIMERFFQ